MSFKRILSKTSLKSYPSSRNCLQSKEICHLNHDIEVLKQTVQSLKNCLEIKDTAIGNLAREKEKLFVELKGAQRTNRDLRQQLLDQQVIHSKEKEHLNEEIERLSRKEEQKGSSIRLTNGQLLGNLQGQLLEKDKVIHSVCAKYLHLKNSKLFLKRKLQRLHKDTQEMYERLILILHENKLTVNRMLDKMLLFSTASRKSKKYLRLIKNNMKLHYDNTQLKIALLRSDNLTGSRETERYEHYDDDCDHCEEELSRYRQKRINIIDADYKYNFKSLRKLFHFKLNNNKDLNPAVINLYKISSTSVLRYTLRKSISLPVLTNDAYHK